MKLADRITQTLRLQDMTARQLSNELFVNVKDVRRCMTGMQKSGRARRALTQRGLVYTILPAATYPALKNPAAAEIVGAWDSMDTRSLKR